MRHPSPYVYGSEKLDAFSDLMLVRKNYQDSDSSQAGITYGKKLAKLQDRQFISIPFKNKSPPQVRSNKSEMRKSKN